MEKEYKRNYLHKVKKILNKNKDIYIYIYLIFFFLYNMKFIMDTI